MAKLDFKVVAAAALEQAPTLLAKWVGGKKSGGEWKAQTTANGGIGDSWCMKLSTGEWLHGAGNEKGGDMISFYAAVHGIENIEALPLVAADAGVLNGYEIPTLAQPKERGAEPIPDDAPDLPGPTPDAVYGYGSSFWIARYQTEKGKTFKQFTWRDGKWVAKGYPEPRPIYNLSEIRGRSQTIPILVVEGEKCADIASEELGSYCVTTWAGGAGQVARNDWTPLTARDVIIWPDADEPGRQAAATLAGLLSTIARSVRVIEPGDRPKGWDIADAVAEGLPLAAWIEANSKAPVMAPTQVTAPTQEILPKSKLSSSAVANWVELGLDCGEDGKPFVTMANVSQIFQAHPNFKGRVWFDSFRERIFHTLMSDEPKPWTDDMDRELTYQLQRSLKLNKFNLQQVREGVQHAAWRGRRNSLTDWLDTLKWDKTPRLRDWLSDITGCERNEYTTAISVNWPLAMVARAYNPGTKMDIMVVLEGQQGAGKSTFLKVLGGEWFKSLPVQFGEKDFLMAIQGAWIVEIPDMTGFSKREHSQILATITIETDEFRAAYGHHSESKPRKCVFAATSETSDYLQSSRGRRRFWPVECSNYIDTHALATVRDQIFAEAIVQLRAGAQFHAMPDIADEEQRARVAVDLWADAILRFAEVQREINANAKVKEPITSALLLEKAVDVKPNKQTDIEKKRVASIMHDAGWIQRRSATLRQWVKPIRRQQ